MSETTQPKHLARWLGLEFHPVSHTERWVSALGGFIGILLAMLIARPLVGEQPAALIVASMAASAVLLFAVPHGQLSQPWAIVGGHLVSALVGVSVVMLVADTVLAAALAVGLATGAMHYLRCIHPPGGATALSAVLGGPSVFGLGYQFVITPVLLNVVCLLVIAVLFNLPFRWRRYPVALHAPPVQPADAVEEGCAIDSADLDFAAREMDLVLPMPEQDLSRLYTLAARHHRGGALALEQISLGACYSNGRFGEGWAVRQVIDESGAGQAEDSLIYKVVAGAHKRQTGTLSRAQLAAWARHRVELRENEWVRVDEEV